jgi:hypothetical protein
MANYPFSLRPVVDRFYPTNSARSFGGLAEFETERESVRRSGLVPGEGQKFRSLCNSAELALKD